MIRRPRSPASAFRPAFLLALPLLAACSAGRRGGPPGDPGGPAPSAATAPADTTTGGRWYGYEGGLKEAEEAAASIGGATQYWREVRGIWRTDADSGTFVAHFQDNRLRRIAVNYGEGASTGFGAYTYDERARLFHYGGEERRRTGRGRNVRTTRTVLSVALDGRGVASATRKTVGGRAQTLTAEEVARIAAREAAVRQAAVAAAR
jgi:hypothetical protein